MADEKVNGGPEEVNAAEPEVMEQAAVDTPPEASAPEPEVVEPAEPAAGDPAVVEPEPEPPAPGEEGEVVVSFEQISELISKRNQEARAAIEQEEVAVSQPGDVDKGSDEPSQQEPAPKRRGRPPKEKKPEHEEKTDKPRRGRKTKEAAPDKDAPKGKARDKVSQGKRGKAAQEQAALAALLGIPPPPGKMPLVTIPHPLRRMRFSAKRTPPALSRKK